MSSPAQEQPPAPFHSDWAPQKPHAVLEPVAGLAEDAPASGGADSEWIDGSGGSGAVRELVPAPAVTEKLATLLRAGR